MTRHDYEIIATALAQALAEADVKEAHGVRMSIEHISHALQIQNDCFQPSKFARFIHQQWASIKS